MSFGRPQILNFPKHTRPDSTIRSIETSVTVGEVACVCVCGGEGGDVTSKIEVARRDDGSGQILTSGPIIAK